MSRLKINFSNSMKVEEVSVAVIGLGYVGLPLAIEFSRLYKVVGYDKNNQRVSELNKGIDKTNEVPKKFSQKI